jgi:hypothetical protein
MNKLLVATFALVSVFSMPASAALTPDGVPPRGFATFQTYPRNTEANPEHHQVQSAEQGSQSRDATGQINDPANDRRREHGLHVR